MFDSPNHQQTQYRRLPMLDYRNGKFQGQLCKERSQRDGIGMALDHNYLLVLAHWRENRVEGPALVIFPNASLFFGKLERGALKGICTFYASSGLLTYCHFRTNGTLAVLDDPSNHTLHLAQFNQLQLLARQKAERDQSDDCLRTQGKSVGVGQPLNYTDQKDKMRILSNLLEIDLEQQHIDHRTFIRQHFLQELNSSLIEVVEKVDQLSVKFKGSSISFKIKDGVGMVSVKQVGFFNHSCNQMELCKKYRDYGNIYEAIGGNKVSYHQSTRPAMCLSRLHIYYRQSLHFKDQFLSIDYLYHIQLTFSSIQSHFTSNLNNYFVQQVLQNSRLRQASPRKINKRRQNEVDCSLDDVKSNIYQAVRAKSLNRFPLLKNTLEVTRTGSSDSAVNRSELSCYVYDSILKHHHQIFKISAKDKERDNFGQNAKPDYHAVSKKTKVSSKCPPNVAQGRSCSPLSKYAYLSESRQVATRRINNLASLTKYYQQIQSDFQKGALSKSGLFSHYLQSARLEGERVLPTGSRKVLAYGWK